MGTDLSGSSSDSVGARSAAHAHAPASRDVRHQLGRSGERPSEKEKEYLETLQANRDV